MNDLHSEADRVLAKPPVDRFIKLCLVLLIGGISFFLVLISVALVWFFVL